MYVQSMLSKLERRMTMATPHLNEYQRKRDFRRSEEPEGAAPALPTTAWKATPT